MAVARTALTSTPHDYPDNEAEQTFAFDCAAGNFLVGFVNTRNDGFVSWPSGTPPRYNSISLTWFPAGQFTGNQCMSRLAYMASPAGGSNNFGSTLNDTSTGTHPGVATAVAYSGVDVGGTPFNEITPTTGTDSTGEIDIPIDAGDLACGFFAARINFASVTGVTGLAEIDEEHYSNDNGLVDYGEASGSGTINGVFTLSGTPSGWALGGLCLNAAAAAATSRPLFSNPMAHLILR